MWIIFLFIMKALIAFQMSFFVLFDRFFIFLCFLSFKIILMIFIENDDYH